MKHRKLTALLLAAATAFSTLPAAAAQISASALTADTGAPAELPDWIPNDYYSAVEFRNKQGATKIGSGLICIVFLEEVEPADVDMPQGVLRYEFSETKGIAQCLRNHVYSMDSGGLGLRVVVYQPQKAGVLEVTHTDTWANLNDDSISGTDSYTFSIEETDPQMHTLSITELGFSSWLPDCRAEYDAYVKEHGLVSAKDDYVIFCMNSSLGTAYTWREVSQDYTEHFEFIKTSSCSTVSGTPAAGGSAYDIAVYRATADGAAKIEWECASFSTDGGVSRTLVADCVVMDNAQTVLLPHMMRISFTNAVTGYESNIPTEETPITLIPSAVMISTGEGTDLYTALDLAPVTADRNPFVWDYSGLSGCTVDIDLNEAALPKYYYLAEDGKKVTSNSNGSRNVEFRIRYDDTPEGDVNGDGEFSIADVILLSKWLLGIRDVPLVSWHAADFHRDGKLNAADFALMKRALMRKNAFDNALIVVEKENAWVNTQQTTAYTRAMLEDSPEIVSLIEKVSQKADALRNADTISWDFRLMDYGTATLYLPLKNADGTTAMLMLSTFGSGNQVLDDPDVLALVRLLSEKHIYGVPDGFGFDESALRAAPVSIAITQRGGFAGVNKLWRIYSEDGKFYASVTDNKLNPAEPQMITIVGDMEFRDFMERDFTQFYNQADPQASYPDAYHYETEFVYADDLRRVTRSNASELQYALQDLIYGIPEPIESP